VLRPLSSNVMRLGLEQLEILEMGGWLATVDTNTLLLAILIVLAVIILILQIRRSTGVSTPLQNLTQAIQNIRVETTQFAEQFRARAEIEKQTAESIKRLETIMAGIGSRGAAGEYVVEEFLSKLPPEWQEQNFRVGNKTVEFGLRLPNRLVLPIDSKWPATRLLEQFKNSDNPDEQVRLKRRIEKEVIGKAKEVQKYIDPNITTPFGIAAIPDPVYNLCPGVNVKTLEYNVVVVSYSLLLPYLLLVFQVILATAHTVDVTKASIHLQAIEQCMGDLQSEVEGRFSNAVTMLLNSMRDLRMHIGKANSALASIQSVRASIDTDSEEANADKGCDQA
jgi:DNA recombination protein RmuC